MLVLSITLNARDKGYKLQVENSRAGGFSIKVDLDDYQLKKVTHDGIVYTEVNLTNAGHLNQKGFADLPIFSVPIRLSDTKNVDVKISNAVFEDIKLQHPVLPSRGVIYRDQDPNDFAYSISRKSVKDEWYPKEILNEQEPYILRKVRGQNVQIMPFQYNAKRSILRVYKSFDIEVVENREAATNPLYRNDNGFNAEMAPLYHSLFVNSRVSQDDWDNCIGEFGELLVVYPTKYKSTIKTYINWKQQMGYTVNEMEVSNGISLYKEIEDAYAANNNILYVVIVGDYDNIKYHRSDPYLGCVAGNDKVYDLIVGRFSAKNTDELSVQINKTINYEKNPDLDGHWYQKALGVASNQSGGGSGDDGEIDYEHIDNIHDNRLSEYTYTEFSELYDGNSGNVLTSEVVEVFNQGMSLINYIGHGNKTGWNTGNYGNGNVLSATNGDKLPFVFSVACLVGRFESGEDCFAEAMLKNPNGGAVATWMSTISQPWAPPMRGQDYANDILTGGYNYDNYEGQNGISTNSLRTTFGSITANAAQLMLSEVGQSDDWDTYKTWTVFGDPSLQVRTAKPKAISISNTQVATYGYTTQVTENGTPCENALVSIWVEGNQPISAFTDENGMVNLPHNFDSDSITITVTGYNLATFNQKVPIGSTVVPVANFSASSIDAIAGDYIQLTDLSEYFPENWYWEMIGAENEMSNERNPIVRYLNPGIYSIKLRVTNFAGENTIIKEEYISVSPVTEAPISEFMLNVYEISAYENIQFTDRTKNMPTSWEWSFPGADIETSQEQNPLISYSVPGVYSVSLKASNEFGEGTTEVKESIIIVKPADYCIPNTNSKYEHIILFNMGDINNESSRQDYSDFTHISTEINHQSQLEFTVGINNSYNPMHLVIWIDWNKDKIFEDTERVFMSEVGGQTTYTGVITMPTDTESGMTRMRIRLANKKSLEMDPCLEYSFGETEDYCINLVKPDNAPIVDFSADRLTTEAGEYINFLDISDNYPINWSWEFEGGEPSVSSDANPSIFYRTPGVYKVSLVATNIIGSNSIVKEAFITINEVNSIPVANFHSNTNTALVFEEVNFSDFSTGLPSAWEWEFEGATPSSSNEQNPSVYYAQPGTYAVSLKSTNGIGESETTVKTEYITINPVEYCKVKTYGHTGNISSFVCANVDNSSDWKRYSDFTSINVELAKGANSTFEIIVNSPEEGSSLLAWADWNRDGNFDTDNELVYSSIETGNSNHTGTITVPSVIYAGSVRFRIRLFEREYNETNPFTACSREWYGESEDYTIMILDEDAKGNRDFNNIINNTLDFEIYPNPAHSEINIKAEGQNMDKIMLINSLGQVVVNLNIESQRDIFTLDVTSLPTGTYLVKCIYQNNVSTQKLIIQ